MPRILVVVVTLLPPPLQSCLPSFIYTRTDSKVMEVYSLMTMFASLIRTSMSTCHNCVPEEKKEGVVMHIAKNTEKGFSCPNRGTLLDCS